MGEHVFVARSLLLLKTGKSSRLKLAQLVLACGIALASPHLLFGIAVPGFPKGADPKAFYGGFFPDEKWLRSLSPLPRDQRRNPQLVKSLAQPDHVDIDSLRREVKPYLKVAPDDLLGLVPRRNRLAGNARVMPSLSRLSL